MITCKSLNTGGLGRFGNQCFSLASTVGIAVKNGQPFGFPRWVNRDNELFGDRADDMQQYFLHELPPMVDVHYTDIPYHWEYRDYNIPTGNWNIQSHLQDPRYFEHCMPLIRELLRMKDEVNLSNYTSVHIRFGDYIDDEQAYHPVCRKAYYQDAVKALGSRDTELLVFSDGTIDQVESRLEGLKYTMFKGDYLESFKAMKMCRHFITANSSYSYMAALLGQSEGKIIIQPSKWFGTAAGIKFDGYYHSSIII